MLHEPNNELNRAEKGLGQVLGRSDYTTSVWIGGATTELISYPSDADFSRQQFLWRVSIATVGKDGAFTRFENTRRNLMVLKGGIHLSHQDEHDCALLPFEQDKFSGNFRTIAKIQQGGATNLNLMCKEGAEGEMLHIALEVGQSHHYALVGGVTGEEAATRSSQVVDLLYNVDGEIHIHHPNTVQQFSLHTGESLFFDRNSAAGNEEIVIQNTGNTLANIVAVRIIYV